MLLDQHVIAGIGNIYADEILHEARLRPDRMSDELGPAAERRLHAAIHRRARGGDRGRRIDARRLPVRRPVRRMGLVPGGAQGLRPGRRTLPDLRRRLDPPHGLGPAQSPTTARDASAEPARLPQRAASRSGPGRLVGATVFLKSLTLKGFKSFADATTMSPRTRRDRGRRPQRFRQVQRRRRRRLGARRPGAPIGAHRRRWTTSSSPAPRSARRSVGPRSASRSTTPPACCRSSSTRSRSRRILFRSGDSEYAINGVPCRLLDVQELLSDAGVGRQQHVIVSQGQIDAVLNARPEERRAIIEEAAGVLKYRRRKEKAERRLDATEANLLRLQDLLREVRRQLRPLERQAEAARRHEELVARARGVAGVRGRAARSRPCGASSSRSPSTGSRRRRTEGELKSELARLDTEIMSFEAQLSARGESDVSDRLVHVEQLRERAARPGRHPRRAQALARARPRPAARRRRRRQPRGRCRAPPPASSTRSTPRSTAWPPSPKR